MKYHNIIRLIVLVCACLGSGTSFAQPVLHIVPPELANEPLPRPEGYDTVDVARLEFVYEQTEIDTVLSRSKTVPCMLHVGERYTHYEDYHQFQQDSVYQTLNWEVTYGKSEEVFNTYPSDLRWDCLYDMQSGRYRVNDAYSFDLYTYEDSTAQFAWTLLPDTVTVCGYVCRKAEATFRGIRWTAWYAPDIAIPAGPWKLNGLPGLILWAYDDKGTHDMKLTAARKARGEVIDFHVGKRFRMKRERVLSLLKRYKTGSAPYENMSGFSLSYTDEHGNPIERPQQREFYVPYELE